MQHLTIQNNRLYLDGQPFIIVESNSPESRLRERSLSETDKLNSYEVNTLYCSCFGGDATTVHPYVNRANPTVFDENKLTQWFNYLNNWIFGYPGKKHIVHLLLSEKENHDELSIANAKLLIDKLAAKFKPLEGYIIWDREEVPNGWSKATELYTYLKQVDPLNIRGMHNNTSQNPWSPFYTSDLVQFLSFQESVNSFDSRIKIEVAKNSNWAGYASEMTGGFQASDIQKTETVFNAGKPYTSGIGFYIASHDQDTQPFQEQYQNIYKRAAELAGNPSSQVLGCTDPLANNYNPSATQNDGSCTYNTGNMQITKIVLVNAITDQDIREIKNGDVLQSTGDLINVNVRAEGTPDVKSVRFNFNGVIKNESVQPWSLFSDTNGNYAPGTIKAGQNNLSVTPFPNTSTGGTPGTPLTINFSVGSGTPTPIPGCTNPLATNYNPNATVDNGTCVFPPAPTKPVVTVDVAADLSKVDVVVKVNGVVKP